MRIAIVGLGLIGGSMARALSGRTQHAIYGLDVDPRTREQAVAAGAVRRMIEPNELDEFDLTLLCLPPRAAVDFASEHLERFARGSTVADVCGVKTALRDALEPMLTERGVRYVGMHPMAGREFSGFDASAAELFDVAGMILTQTERTEQSALLQLYGLAMELGCQSVVICSPEEHDRIIAYTSQLAHVVSSAYVKSPTAERYRGFSAGSFQDMTRVARLDERMWTQLFLSNRDPLLQEIDRISEHLQEYRDAIAAGDGAKLESLLREGRLCKERTEKR